MTELPIKSWLKNGPVTLIAEEQSLRLKEAEALVTLSQAVKSLTAFVTEGGLQAVVAAHTKGSIISQILGGLAAKDGRNALDARVIKQNAIEIAESVVQVFSKMHERMQDSERDPEIKDAEKDLKEREG